MLQAAPLPLRESSSVVRLPGATHEIDVTGVKRTGQRQPRAGGQLGPPQCHRRAERRRQRSLPVPRRGPAWRLTTASSPRSVLPKLPEFSAKSRLSLPTLPADAACRTPSPPCRVGPTRTPPAGRGPGQAMWQYLPKRIAMPDHLASSPGAGNRCTAPRASAAWRGTTRCGHGAGRGAALDGGHGTGRGGTALDGPARRGHGTGRRGAADLVSPKRPASQAPVEVEVAGGAAVVNLRVGRAPLPCSEWRIVHSGV